MATVFTIDASVFVAACRPQEGGFAASGELLHLVRETNTPLIEPAILPVEIAAALARSGENPEWAKEYANSTMNLPYLTILSVDEHMARRALAMAAERRLRGSDALYAATAIQYGAVLITLDTDQLKRAPASAHACKPDAACALIG